MTVHTPIPYHSPAAAATFNAPLDELDAAIVALTSALNVKDFGALGDDTTDDTAAITAAVAAAEAGDGRLVWPAGTYLVDGAIVISSSTSWRAAPGAEGQVVIKRNAASTDNYMLNVLSPSFDCVGITFDGNKGSNANPINLVYVNTTCLRSYFMRCGFINAKLSGGYGGGLDIRSLVANSVRHIVDTCIATGNDGGGISANDALGLTITNCHVYSNGSGIMVLNTDVTVTQKVNEVFVTNNYVHNHTSVGIQVADYSLNNTPNVFDYSPGNPDTTRAVVSGNIVRTSGTYGIAIQNAKFLNCANNVVTNCADGVLFDAEYSQFTGNTIADNTTFGVDAGFSRFVNIANNLFSGNATGLNCPSRSANVTGNQFTDNTNHGIEIVGTDSDGSYHSVDFLIGDAIATNVAIMANFFSYPTGGTGGGTAGLYVYDNPLGLAVVGNTFLIPTVTEADLRRAFIYIGDKNNVHVSGNEILSYPTPVLTTSGGGVVLVPDVLDMAFLNSATAITSLRYYGSEIVGTGGIGYITMTARGSGYSASTAVVTITGGGGTGATAVAVVFEPTGHVVAVRMTAYGSGYTSAPTVTITDGAHGGSGATATAHVGVELMSDRKLSLVCLQAQTFNRLGTPNINNPSGANVPVSATGIIDLRSGFGAWYSKA